MKFKVTRNALLAELNLVQGVVEKKSTIPILSNILISASGNRIDMTATDLDVSVCCGCEAEVQSEGTMTVSAKRLFEIVRLLPDGAEIECRLLDNDWLGVKAGKSIYKVVGLPRENFPSVPEPQGKTVSLPGNILRGMIQRTMFAITQEESRYSLNGAQLVLTPQEMKMVATDGHRLALVTASVPLTTLENEMRALIPRKTLVEIQKLVGEDDMTVEFGRDDNHLFFRVGAKRLVSRVLAGQFPNYEMVIPRDNDKNVTAPTKVLAEGIRRAAVMSDEKLKAIRLSLQPGILELSASSADAGEASESIEVDYQGGEMEIGFNPLYLLDFLGACGSENTTFSLRDFETQGMMRPAGNPAIDYRYVVMPMKF
jgi:DNA polymerase III subunit beta